MPDLNRSLLSEREVDTLDGLSDVTLNASASGEFLKYNGTVWVNDLIDLGTDTNGNYMSDVTAGQLITITHTPGEGSNATIAISNGTSAQIILADASGVPTYATVSGDVTITNTGNVQIAANAISNADISTTAAIDISKLANSTTTGLGIGTIELGHATDTTLARGAAGRLTVEGVNVPTISSTDTLTNKTLSSATLTGTLTANGSTGTNGQFLQSTATGVQWAAAGGSVTTTTVNTNTATEVYSYNPSTYNTVELIIQVTQGSKRTSQKAFVNHNGSSTALITNYAVLEHGTTRIPLTMSADWISASIVRVSITITDAATTSATVKVVPTLLEV